LGYFFPSIWRQLFGTGLAALFAAQFSQGHGCPILWPGWKLKGLPWQL
jgi:hypothetical protein